jgi:hypothetical protein
MKLVLINLRTGDINISFFLQAQSRVEWILVDLSLSQLSNCGHNSQGF